MQMEKTKSLCLIGESKDSSKEMKNEEICYSFIAILQHHLGVTEANLSKQELHDLYQRYQDQSSL